MDRSRSILPRLGSTHELRDANSSRPATEHVKEMAAENKRHACRGAPVSTNNTKQRLLPPRFIVHDAVHDLSTMQTTSEIPSFEGPEDVLRRRAAPAQQNTLETVPIPSAFKGDGFIPNTPLAASTISFLLGSVFTVGVSIVVSGGCDYWWCTCQIGFFFAAWSAFHWGEFAVTAGWNREKCSVDCEFP